MIIDNNNVSLVSNAIILNAKPKDFDLDDII